MTPASTCARDSVAPPEKLPFAPRRGRLLQDDKLPRPAKRLPVSMKGAVYALVADTLASRLFAMVQGLAMTFTPGFKFVCTGTDGEGFVLVFCGLLWRG